MINKVLVNGVQINTDKCFLARLGNISAADIEVNSYTRGGRSGVSLSRPVYRGFKINMEWVVKGDGMADLITQRERLMRCFKAAPELDDQYLRTLQFELANGVQKQADVVFSPLVGDLDPSNVNIAYFKLTAMTEKEFFESATLKTLNIVKGDLGGMAIPMPIPMDMSNNPTAVEAIANNEGTAESYPVITVHGDHTDGFDLINDTTGKTLTYNETLDAGDYVEFDFYNHTAVKNGVTNVLAKVSGDWWYIDPGTNDIRISSTTGDGYAVCEYRDCYRGI